VSSPSVPAPCRSAGPETGVADPALSFRGAVPEMRGEEQRYFDYCQQGRLMIQRCPHCALHVFYPRAICPHCTRGDLEWVEAEGRGLVFTYAVHHRFPPGFEGAAPYVVAIVELAEGVRMMTRIMAAPEDVSVGMEVRVAFAAAAEDFQVPVFLPVEPAA